MKATKLKDLKVTSVDLVEAGANQHAHIQLKKRREDGAEAASGDNAPEETTNSAFFSRLAASISKGLKEVFNVSKGDAKTFDQSTKHRDIDETIWDISGAMCESLRSILFDDELSADAKRAMLEQTAAQVREAILSDLGECIEESPDVSKADKEGAPDEEDKPEDDEQTEKGCKNREKTAKAASKEGETIMSDFDTTNLTPEEKAQFDLFKSKLVVKSDVPTAAPVYDPEKDTVAKAMREEIEVLKKDAEVMRDQMVQRELEGVAKKYEVLGKKPEELVPVLKSMKAAGEAVYDQYIKTLDEHLDVIEKSGMFSEIGKRGTSASNDPVEKVYAAAAEIRKSNPALSHAEAVDQAWAQHPELVNEYEQSR